MPIELRLTKAFECKSGSESGGGGMCVWACVQSAECRVQSAECRVQSAHTHLGGGGGGHRKTVLFIGNGAHRSHTYAHKTNPEIHDIQTETQICVRGHCVNYRR